MHRTYLYQGAEHTVPELLEIAHKNGNTSLKLNVLKARLSNLWDIEKALTTSTKKVIRNSKYLIETANGEQLPISKWARQFYNEHSNDYKITQTWYSYFRLYSYAYRMCKDKPVTQEQDLLNKINKKVNS